MTTHERSLLVAVAKAVLQLHKAVHEDISDGVTAPVRDAILVSLAHVERLPSTKKG